MKLSSLQPSFLPHSHTPSLPISPPTYSCRAWREGGWHGLSSTGAT